MYHTDMRLGTTCLLLGLWVGLTGGGPAAAQEEQEQPTLRAAGVLPRGIRDSVTAARLSRWGGWEDPDGLGGVAAVPRGDDRVLEIFTDPTSTESTSPLGNAPRVRRPLSGDFGFQLRISWPAGRLYRWPDVRMGPGPRLFLYANDDHYYEIALNFDAYEAALGTPRYQVWTRWRPAAGGDPWTVTDSANVWFRLEREGATVRSFFGYDGSTWIPVSDAEVGLPDSIDLVLAVPNANTGLMVATFSPPVFDGAAVADGSLVEDPYRVAQEERERERRVGYFTWLLIFTGFVAIVWLALDVWRVRAFGSGVRTMERGPAFAAYVWGFGVASVVVGFALSLAASDQYMGGVITISVMLFASPFLAAAAMLWVPIGRWYASALAKSGEQHGPPGFVLVLAAVQVVASATIAYVAIAPEPALASAVAAHQAIGVTLVLVEVWRKREA